LALPGMAEGVLVPLGSAYSAKSPLICH